ncbi:hypothetical protein ABT369_37570 [Dactylosporangium sp. NPDC000244]|uniref:hypothetical protein n=1 Tax=Dactylosporangium sp. NPDC000244 TaxID=3154365 RepID=UPI0033321211
MDVHVRRADELARTVAARFAEEGLVFAYELQPYGGVCMAHVDLADDDGFTFTVARADPYGWIEILDPGDYHLPPTALLHYALLRARGARPGDAWETALNADPNGMRRPSRRRASE